MKSYLSRWVPVAGWMGVIFFLSNQPELKSGLEIWQDFILRKLAHMAEFAVLTWLIFRAVSLSPAKRLWIAVVGALLYAIVDEWHQSFIPGRQCAWRDVLIDAGGIVSMAGYLLMKHKKF